MAYRPTYLPILPRRMKTRTAMLLENDQRVCMCVFMKVQWTKVNDLEAKEY